MSVIRVKKEEKYSVISNAVLHNKSLTWEARGIMAYLLSKPDGWECRNYDLVNQGPASEHVIRRVLKELQEAGYIHRYRKSAGRGKIEWVTEIYETPELNTALRNGTFSSIENIETESFNVEKSVHIVSTDSQQVLTPKNTDLNAKSSKSQNPPIIEANSYIEKYTDTERAALNTLGPIIADQASGGSVPSLDGLRAVTVLGYEIAQYIQLDILAVDKTELKALAGQALRMYAKPNINAKLKAHKTWWYNEYWLGKQGQPPTLKQLGQTWGQFEAAKVGPPANGNAPTLTDAQRARYEKLTAENATK